MKKKTHLYVILKDIEPNSLDYMRFSFSPPCTYEKLI